MDFVPSRALGLFVGGGLLLALLAAVGLGVVQLASTEISLITIVWVWLPLVGLPLALIVAYRLYGLATASYRLDRDGFSLRWGFASEQVALQDLSAPGPADQSLPPLSLWRSLWWPGCYAFRSSVKGVGAVDYFATTGPEGWVLLSAGDGRHLVISPPDHETFQQAFVDATRLGSLEHIPTLSQRPDFLFTRLWEDRWARALILGGLLLPALLLVFLAVRAPGLPALVPFGFDSAGSPSLLAPPGRLLLLPFIAGLCWLADVLAGAWLYRNGEDRPLAYLLWATAVLVGGLLWGATLQLLAAV